jgi:hypothetical protein
VVFSVDAIHRRDEFGGERVAKNVALRLVAKCDREDTSII